MKNYNQILTYDFDCEQKLMLKNIDLVDFAEMYRLSIPVFLYLFRLYLFLDKAPNNKSLYTFNYNKNLDIIIPDVPCKYLTPLELDNNYPRKSSIIVPEDRYDEIIEKIAIFAYSHCSNRVYNNCIVHELNKLKLACSLSNSIEYTAIYPSANNELSHWNKKNDTSIHNFKIDEKLKLLKSELKK